MPNDFIPLPLVDQETYDEIDCNGCGDCCASFSLNEQQDPLTLMWQTATLRVETYDAFWFGQLVPAYRDDLGYYVYACSFFERSDDLQTGRCTIHETRPEVCRAFPNGRDGASDCLPRRCSWAEVEVT